MAAICTGCPGVDLGDTPEDIGLCNPAKGFDFFKSDVYPKYIERTGAMTSCVKAGGGCHDAGGGNALTFQTNPIDAAANYRAAQVYLNCGIPQASELLTKPLAGADPHGGQDIFPTIADPAVAVFIDWFQ
ncbi:MAG: hypothetical protein NT062_16140 [Proteobacteria bacterium]|nr:hypothetical protein [Pseudomonadota bacterium]